MAHSDGTGTPNFDLAGRLGCHAEPGTKPKGHRGDAQHHPGAGLKAPLRERGRGREGRYE